MTREMTKIKNAIEICSHTHGLTALKAYNQQHKEEKHNTLLIIMQQQQENMEHDQGESQQSHSPTPNNENIMGNNSRNDK